MARARVCVCQGRYSRPVCNGTRVARFGRAPLSNIVLIFRDRPAGLHLRSARRVAIGRRALKIAVTSRPCTFEELVTGKITKNN